jgi:hypothetical protein
MIRIRMQELEEGNGGVLAGAINGRKVLARLLDRTAQEPVTPETVFLDFDGVQVATASFLRESVLAFRDAVRRRRSNLYPAIANANELVAEELRVLVGSHGNALMLCSLDESGPPRDRRLVGELDPKQRLTFDLVSEHGETDAAELMREHGGGEKTPTVWNNRLTALTNLGLLVELSRGRSKRYRPLLAGS